MKLRIKVLREEDGVEVVDAVITEDNFEANGYISVKPGDLTANERRLLQTTLDMDARVKAKRGEEA